MSARTITLTATQLAALRGKGQTYDNQPAIGDIVRLLRDGSGYLPLPGASNEILLSDADLDLIERDPAGLVCASTDGITGWTVRLS